jgi:hypothetical protein
MTSPTKENDRVPGLYSLVGRLHVPPPPFMLIDQYGRKLPIRATILKSLALLGSSALAVQFRLSSCFDFCSNAVGNSKHKAKQNKQINYVLHGFSPAICLRNRNAE